MVLVGSSGGDGWLVGSSFEEESEAVSACESCKLGASPGSSSSSEV